MQFAMVLRMCPKPTHEGNVDLSSGGWLRLVILGLLPVCCLLACQPKVAVEAPSEPITINLNIKLDAEVRVKLEEQAEQDIESYPNIF